MGAGSPDQNVRTRILHFFEWTSQRVWTHSQLDNLLAGRSIEWSVPDNFNSLRFVDLLRAEGILTRYELSFARSVSRFCREPCSPLEVALSLHSAGYLWQHTAAFLHGLTPLLPETIYLNVEQNRDGRTGDLLRQASVDAAFRGAPRLSNNRARWREWEICQLCGKRTGQFGVIEETHPKHGHLRYTNLERTLIDIAVRPFYAGGPLEVLRAYTAAAGLLSAKALAETLQALDFAYPYHQAVGFYLERGGASDEVLEVFRLIPQQIDFYLDYQLKNPVYCPEWRVYYPAALDPAHSQL